jgi:hypothetical protein
MRTALRAEMQPNPAYEAGEFVAFGGMTHQPRRFVDHQQAFIFKYDFKKWVHFARESSFWLAKPRRRCKLFTMSAKELEQSSGFAHAHESEVRRRLSEMEFNPSLRIPCTETDVKQGAGQESSPLHVHWAF